ncbi:MAG: hypothetical protein IT379_36145, partial [Deltaproteobacteria bacterium]|nr:hypothetical protein [Deltaproteobacteria bacterium]
MEPPNAAPDAGSSTSATTGAAAFSPLVPAHETPPELSWKGLLPGVLFGIVFGAA